MLEGCDTATAGRLSVLSLAPVITAYEHAMTEGEGRNTWRSDRRHSPCPRDAAGVYLAFLASLGYRLSRIEQALVDDIPYTGETSPDDLEAAGNNPPWSASPDRRDSQVDGGSAGAAISGGGMEGTSSALSDGDAPGDDADENDDLSRRQDRSGPKEEPGPETVAELGPQTSSDAQQVAA
jgi:hypothetical protein